MSLLLRLHPRFHFIYLFNHFLFLLFYLIELALPNVNPLPRFSDLFFDLLTLLCILLADSKVLFFPFYLLIQIIFNCFVPCLFGLQLLTYSFQVRLITACLMSIFVVFSPDFIQPSRPLRFFILQVIVKAIGVLIVIAYEGLKFFDLERQIDDFTANLIHSLYFLDLPAFLLQKFVPIEIAVEFDLYLTDDVLFELDPRLIHVRALPLVPDCIFSEGLDFFGDEFDLFEDAAVEFLHQKLLMLIVDNGLVRINAYGVQQFGYVAAPLLVQISQLHVLAQQTLRYFLQFLQLTLNALLLALQNLVLAAYRLHQIKHRLPVCVGQLLPESAENGLGIGRVVGGEGGDFVGFIVDHDSKLTLDYNDSG